MASTASDSLFSGSVPELYERYLVPLIFEPYARDLSARVARRSPRRVLEIAAGTGAVTRELALVLPATEIIATDLNGPMLEQARQRGTHRQVEWQVADAMQLPFEDAGFDAVVCQFGAMFFPDRAQAFAEARRVLRPGGVLLFNVWDSLATNEFAETVTQALQDWCPDDPPRFLARTPHGYCDPAAIASDLARAGFDRPGRIDTVTARSIADSPRIPAIAFCQGTPLRGEIEVRAPGALLEATEAVTRAIAARFGPGPVDGRIQALVVAAEL